MGIINENRNFRVGGSGFTTIFVGGKPVSYCRMASDVSPAPVGPGVVPIHPMDSEYPIELITPQAVSMGTLTLEIYDRWSVRFWNQEAFRLAYGGDTDGDGDKDPNSAKDLVDIFRKIGKRGAIHVSKVAKFGPQHEVENQDRRQVWNYHGCVIANVLDGEQVEVGTMEVLKQIIINYRRVTQEKK